VKLLVHAATADANSSSANSDSSSSSDSAGAAAGSTAIVVASEQQKDDASGMYVSAYTTCCTHLTVHTIPAVYSGAYC
jgi:hypothetical protein